MNYAITGSDVTEITPVNGVIYVGGIIKHYDQLERIKWKSDNASGSTICRAYEGQYEIDKLVRAGYKILSVGLFVFI